MNTVASRMPPGTSYTAGDIRLYRAFEMIPGTIAWTTLIGMVIASWLIPIATSFFIILFDLYWLLKTIFFSMHITATYRKMKEHMKIDWMERVQNARIANDELRMSDWKKVRHLIILPAYKEPYDVLRSSVEAVVKSTWPNEKMIVVIALEERGGAEDAESAEKVKQEFGSIFLKFLITRHPSGLPDEIPGKGSNATWAAKEARKIIDELSIPYEHVIISSLDSDTRVYPEYFSIVAYHYLTAKDPLRSSYQPVPVYHNNIWDAPAFSRVIATSDTFWQMVQQSRPERLVTFSSHSMPFKGLVELGFWQTNIVSEDSRIFFQALMHNGGRWSVVPLYYPVSMDANLAPSLIRTGINVYRQHRRWVWGVENIPFLLFSFWKDRRISMRKKLFHLFDQFEGFWSLSTNAIMILALGWLPPFIGGDAFSVSVLAHNLPRVTQGLMTASMIGLAFSAIISLSLLPTRPKKKPYHWKWWLLLEWFFIPITGTMFGAVPGLEAQTRLMLGKPLGFWRTPKVRKTETQNPNQPR